jgi:hypothetical protein
MRFFTVTCVVLFLLAVPARAAELIAPSVPEEAHLIAVPGAGNYFNVLLQHRFDA